MAKANGGVVQERTEERELNFALATPENTLKVM